MQRSTALYKLASIVTKNQQNLQSQQNQQNLTQQLLIIFNDLSSRDKSKLWKYIKKTQVMPNKYYQRRVSQRDIIDYFRLNGPLDPLNKSIILHYIKNKPQILQQYKG